MTIRVLEPDGTERTLATIPRLAEMQQIVGGSVEFVKVLRQDLEGFNYTYMIVNEEGRLLDLPRNQRATDVYLANIRRAYAGHPDPIQAAENDFRENMDRAGVAVIEMHPPAAAGPYIAGPAIWFDGWLVHELDRVL